MKIMKVQDDNLTSSYNLKLGGGGEECSGPRKILTFFFCCRRCLRLNMGCRVTFDDRIRILAPSIAISKGRRQAFRGFANCHFLAERHCRPVVLPTSGTNSHRPAAHSPLFVRTAAHTQCSLPQGIEKAHRFPMP